MNYFEGQLGAVRVFPFAMRDWERRIFLRNYPLLYLTAASLDIPIGEPVSVWKDSSGALNEKLLPRWFRAWLWLRTQWARRSKREPPLLDPKDVKKCD